ncbi:hypothetical protein MD588_11305 [Photobacterium sp. SDRW27]|uniref:hypothetical protein n=1 Tax=Photobacterium obscurum TaxID=2829490 RepID=UPI002243CDC2|nr:hypothetical protein [Photobacterium obscurum]MCW8329395.1 hypothetical protein [Photobacterium obscurum]
MRYMCVLILLFGSVPSQATSIDQYKKQYRNLPCDDITNAISGIKTKQHDAKVKTKEFTKIYVALAELRLAKSCIGKAYS